MDGPNYPGEDLDEEWAKTRAKAEIDAFKAAVEDAEVVEVDEPAGRKQVEIAWEDEDGFHVEEGEAIGVYRVSDANGLDGEPRTAIECYHIDWADDRERTTVERDQLVDLEEGDYYTDEDE